MRAKLRNNLWQIINKEPITYINWRKLLIDALIDNEREIVPLSQYFLTGYVVDLEKEYAQLLDYIDQEAINGDILELEKYVSQHVNGTFTRTLRNFVIDYDKNKKKDFNRKISRALERRRVRGVHYQEREIDG